MAKTTTLTSDYTQLAKEYKLPNQKISLWDQFLTGQQSYYQGLAQQVSDVASYDISQAYANYKQQQLQLQMSEQLGTGFKEQIGSQLQSQYGTAFQDIRTQEASSLAEVRGAYQTALETGEEEFTELGKRLKIAETLTSEFAEAAGITAPENAYKIYTDEQGNVVTELTDYGRLWYADVLKATTTEGQTFDQWLLSETSSSTLDYEDRENFLEFYRQNPDLVRSQVFGLTGDFDAESTRTKLAEEERQSAISTLQQTASDREYSFDYSNLSTTQASTLQTNMERNPELVSTRTSKDFKRGDNVVDDNGHVWNVKDQKPVYFSDNTQNYKSGDIIVRDGKTYWIVSMLDGRATTMELTEENPNKPGSRGKSNK